MTSSPPDAIIRDHSARYPLMRPRDVVKLCYQACFGAGHLLSDPQAAHEYLIGEYKSAGIRPDEPLFEELPGGYARLNLGAAKRDGLASELVFRAVRDLRRRADSGRGSRRIPMPARYCRRVCL